jgi:hypothetical protein
MAKNEHQDHWELLCSWGSEHSDLEALSKVDSENYNMSEMLVGNYEEFSFISSSPQCCHENEDCEVVERIATKHQKIRKLMRMTQLSMKDTCCHLLTGLRSLHWQLFRQWTRRHNVALSRQHLDVTGVGTPLQVVFPVGCLCVVLCCSGVDFWCFGGLPPDICSISDEMSVIITFTLGECILLHIMTK